MITISNLRLQRGTKVLLDKVNARIDTGQKVGLVGRNGTGKSSLFALMRGELLADEGDLYIPANWTIAHVAQEMPETDESALDYVLAGDAELTALNLQLEKAIEDDDGEAMGTVYADMATIDAYTAPSRAAQLLNGLGFAQALQSNAVKSFSGGWRMRLNLARALMCRSDLLLLDEPTNHLDLDTVLWLEQYLKSHPATQLIISHDRDFLDALCTHIIEVAQQTLTSYKGNYTQFERIRGERLIQQQALYAQQQRHIAHLQSYIDRFRAQALLPGVGMEDNYLIANPHLKPERSRGMELGVRGRMERLSVDVVGFYNRYSNLIEDARLIERTPLKQVFQTVNITRAKIYGFEVKGIYDWGQVGSSTDGRLRSSFSYGQTRGKDVTSNSPLNSVSPAQLSVGLRYDTPHWGVYANARHYAAKRDQDIDLVSIGNNKAGTTQFATPSATTLDVGMQWRPRSNVRLNLALNNLTNQKYWRWADVYGQAANSPTIDAYTQPGRNIKIALTADF